MLQDPSRLRSLLCRRVGAPPPDGTTGRPGSRRVEQFDSVVCDDGPHLGEVALRLTGERDPGMADPADLDALVHLERDGDDLRVAVVTDDAGRDRVPVESAHGSEAGRTVGDPDLPLARPPGEYLLGELDRVVAALIKSAPRPAGQIVERDALPGGQWVLAGDEDARERR